MGYFRGWVRVFVLAACCAAMGPACAAAGERATLDDLRREIEELRRRDAERQREVDALKAEVRRLRDGREVGAKSARGADAPGAPTTAGASALDRAVEEATRASSDLSVGALASPPAAAGAAVPPPGGALFTRRIGGAQIRLLDISFDTLLAVGGSTVRDGEIAQLQGGAHDPKRRGFTLQQAELSFAAAVDPYFTAEAHVLANTDHVELEEAFFTTTALPGNLQLEGGYFLTEFGRINPTHSHAWHWIDQPVINTRLFGGEGLRAPGARLGWLTPLPWFSELHVGAQNPNEGEFTASFLGDDGVGGRPVVKTDVGSMKDLLYLTRWNNAWNWNDSLTTLLGFSALFGPNVTGGDGRTWIYGADMLWKWQPPNHFRGWPFVLWQTEVMRRDYDADRFVAGTEADGGDDDHGHDQEDEEEPDDDEPVGDLPAADLDDWGLYTQLLWGFRPGWAVGLRYEYATGSGASLDGGRQADFLRDDRHRLSPLILWQPSEFSRIRLQYDFDRTEFLPSEDAHSVWMSFEVLYGAHPAHQY